MSPESFNLFFMSAGLLLMAVAAACNFKRVNLLRDEHTALKARIDSLLSPADQGMNQFFAASEPPDSIRIRWKGGIGNWLRDNKKAPSDELEALSKTNEPR